MICLLPNCTVLSAAARMLEIHRALRDRGAGVRVATHGGTHEWVLRDAGVEYDLLGGAEAGYLREIGARAVVTGRSATALDSSRLAGIPLVSVDAGDWVPPMWERGLLPLPFEPLGVPFERWVPRRWRNVRAVYLKARGLAPGRARRPHPRHGRARAARDHRDGD